MRRLFLTSFAFAIGLTLSGMANAAPQILLVVSPDEEIPMTCEGAHCTVELTAICLQPERANPLRGARYMAMDADTITLVGSTAAGETRRLPITKTMQILAEREHTAVTLSVPRVILDMYQVSELTVRLQGNVVLAPTPVANDAKPQTEADIALAKTTLRKTAESVISQRGDQVAAAGLLRKAINALPRERAPSQAERDAAETLAMTTRALAKSATQAKTAFDTCRGIGDTFSNRWYHNWFSYRNCLSVEHDSLIEEVNKEYWEVLKAGS